MAYTCSQLPLAHLFTHVFRVSLGLETFFSFYNSFQLLLLLISLAHCHIFISYSCEESVFSLLVTVFDSRKNVTKNKKCVVHFPWSGWCSFFMIRLFYHWSTVHPINAPETLVLGFAKQLLIKLMWWLTQVLFQDFAWCWFTPSFK